MINALKIYKKAMRYGTGGIEFILARRLKAGKEDATRLNERRGIASLPRPDGALIWVHCASVGEAQSMLSLITLLLNNNPALSILVTSGTKTSAELLFQRLPDRAMHQYVPVDHPDWVRRFIEYWKPDFVLWAESELWPNLLGMLKKKHIPTALINAHMSPKSFNRWKKIKSSAQTLLECFTVIMAQTEADAAYYKNLGARSVAVTDNIKYAAKPLPFDKEELENLVTATHNRPLWVYASTHAGEEEIACNIHKQLKTQFPELLSIIIPRHPERRFDVLKVIEDQALNTQLRTQAKTPPQKETDIYIVDTLGEMGLFYSLAPLSVIGRSFSKDGGGGHNPIEAALLHSAVLHGPNVQNLAQIFDDMDKAGAAYNCQTPEILAKTIEDWLKNPEKLKQYQQTGFDFATRKATVIKRVIEELEPLFIQTGLPVPKMV